jgi:VWFA-related protein
VFIDDYFAIAPHRNAVLQSLKADLARLGPEDRMAIVAYDGGRLAMISNWLGSRNALERAFDEAMTRPARGFDRAKELQSFLRDENFASTITGDDQVLDLAVLNSGLNEREYAYADTLVRQVKGVVGATVSAMRGFAAPEGRKVLLLLSGGWPFSPQSYVKPDGMPTRTLPDGGDLFGPLTSTANLLGYTIYPVDVPGLQTEAASATAEGVGAGGPFNLREQEIEGAVEFIAQQTGGKPLLDNKRAEVLTSASADTRSYYWIGFSPSWQKNDKAHAVKVEVRRPGLEARSRTGFLDLSRKAEVSMKVESALLFGNMPGTFAMPMRVGALERPKKGKGMEVPITLGLPVDLMTVVPVNGKYAAQLELRFAASDSEGNGSEIPVLPITLTSDKPPTPGKMVKYETRLKLRGKADRLVVAVYDPLSGKIATAEAKLEEGAAK